MSFAFNINSAKLLNRFSNFNISPPLSALSLARAVTLEKLGSLDILVNNAGILEMGSIENTSLDQYDKVMNTNVRAIYQLTMLAVPHLIKTQGREGLERRYSSRNS